MTDRISAGTSSPSAAGEAGSSGGVALSAGSSSGAITGPSGLSQQVPQWMGKQIGRFRLLSILGKGAYGRVFLAEDVDLQRRVALKLITAEATAKSVRAAREAEGIPSASGTTGQTEAAAREAVERMVREARAAARLHHPNVVQIYEVGRVKLGTPAGESQAGFIAMELCEGGTLAEIVEAAGPMDPARACALIADAAEALQQAHALGVIHRDVKPANLMLARDGRCKVVDFGLAWVEDPADGRHYARAVGTPGYLAPEVIRGKLAGPASDIYSLGATLFALLAGRPPYVGDRNSVFRAHVHRPPPDLRPVRPEIDDRLAGVIQKAMAKDPEDRFRSAGQFAKSLRVFTIAVPGSGAIDSSSGSAAWTTTRREVAPTRPALPPEHARAAPPAPPSASRAIPRRKRGGNSAGISVAIAAALLFLLVGALAFFVIRGGEQPTAPELARGEAPAVPAADRQPDRPTPGRSSVEIGGHSAGAGASTNDRPGASSPEAPSHRRPAADDQPPPRTRQPADDPTPQRATSRDQAADRQARPAPGTSTTPQRPLERSPATEEIYPYERARLMRLAGAADSTVTVRGTVISAATSSTGRVFHVTFAGADTHDAFTVVWFPRNFDVMARAFGGENGAGIEGKHIRATGRISIYRDNPQMVIEDPAQIEIIE